MPCPCLSAGCIFFLFSGGSLRLINRRPIYVYREKVRQCKQLLKCMPLSPLLSLFFFIFECLFLFFGSLLLRLELAFVCRPFYVVSLSLQVCGSAEKHHQHLLLLLIFSL